MHMSYIIAVVPKMCSPDPMGIYGHICVMDTLKFVIFLKIIM